MKPKPHIVVTTVACVLGLLGIAAAVPKIMQMPQELQFLRHIGLDGIAVSVLGIVQLIGGCLLFPRKHRLLGVGLSCLAFVTSSVAIFAGGNIQFGLMSLLPVFALVGIAYYLRSDARSNVV
ncbi:MAG: hypothetical protein AB8G16_01605 [Gammaproteobacteria bacterium]